jgi:hypothetical protein
LPRAAERRLAEARPRAGTEASSNRPPVAAILAFPSDEVFHGLALLVLPIVAGGLIGYFFNGTDGAVVGMFVAFGVMILVAFLWAGGDAGG